MVERRGRLLRVGVGSTFDGEPRDCGHRFEEGPDNVLVVGEQRVAVSLQDERAKWMRSVSERLRFAVSSSVFFLCSSCETVLSCG